VPSLTWIVDLADPAHTSAVGRLRRSFADAGYADAGDSPTADVLLVWVDRPLADSVLHRLATTTALVVLAGSTLELGDPDGRLADRAGLLLGSPTPSHDIRVRAGTDAPSVLQPAGHAHHDATHLGEHVHVVDRVLTVDKQLADVQVLLTAQVGLVAQPVATWRPASKLLVWSLGTTTAATDSRPVNRLLMQCLGHVLGEPARRPVRVGLLGYGAIGHEHSRAARAVAGLELAAVCDTSQQRLTAAHEAAPEVRGYLDPDDLLADAGLDLVVISTPPSTHAEWALRAIEAGKHVVVEKPFALRTEEADAVLDAASARKLLAVVYQNRRFDPDHLAIKRLVEGGRLGEVFQLETFVGGYGHPCNLWHSDEGVSGGAFYDWGSHVLDQILDLMPGEISYVTAANHKRRWFDVTNADHSRVTIRFASGAEAEFIHSDLAAALKPRWYVLGTEGAVVGSWRTETVVARSDIGTLVEDVLAPADSPPRISLHAGDGSVTQVATPHAPPYEFHQELADLLLLGLPMSVTGEQSRRVLSVMEAARASAADDGRPVTPR